MVQKLLDGFWLSVQIWAGVIMEAIYSTAQAMLVPVFEKLLPGHDVWGILSEYYEILDMWLDVDLIVGSIVGFGTFWMAWIVYRNVKSWLPTLGS